MKVEEILSKLVSFNTVKDKDNLLIMNFCKEYLEGLGFKCTLYGNEKKFLYANYGENPILGFIGHTDTVNYSEYWDTDPFTLTYKDGKYYGLGTSDMKGGIAAFLKAVSNIDLRSLNRGISVILTYDEEINFEGIINVVSEKIDLPEYLIIGEPTDNIPNNGSKGLLEYSITFNGVRTHSSMPVESSNVNCVKFFSEILKLEDYFKERSCSDYEFPNSTMNIGVIKGGNSVNIVPDNTFATLDFRITSSVEELNYVKKYVDEVSKKYNMKYSLNFSVNPFLNEDEIIKVYEEICGNVCQKFNGITEASFIEGNRIILGPGPINAHKDNEFITKESIDKTVSCYDKIIKVLCENK